TTWPISTVFRLYLENLNWVPNAQTASGPTPKAAPAVLEFLRGIDALQLLQDRGLIVFGAEEREERVGGRLPASAISARDQLEAVRAGMEYREERSDEKSEQRGWQLIRKTTQAVVRVDPEALKSPEVEEFTRVFRLKPGMDKYDITQETLNPFP